MFYLTNIYFRQSAHRSASRSGSYDLLYLSFTDDVFGLSWYIAEKVSGAHFVVRMSGAMPATADFDWWIVDAPEAGEVQWSSEPPTAQEPEEIQNVEVESYFISDIDTQNSESFEETITQDLEEVIEPLPHEPAENVFPDSIQNVEEEETIN